MKIAQDLQEFYLVFNDAIGEKEYQNLFTFNFQDLIQSRDDLDVLSKRIEPNNHIPLNIRDLDNLGDCFKRFQEPEIVDGYQSTKHKKEITILKKMVLESGPEVFAVVLKRMVLNYQTWKKEVLSTSIKFEEDYKVEMEDGSKTPYKLYSILCFDEKYDGYYPVCYLGSKWYKYKNEKVEEVNDISKFYTKAYLLFYQKVVQVTSS